MVYGLAADLLVLIHFSFIIFVVLGGLLLLRWPRVAFAHLPAVIWGAWIEFAQGTCPLTPLEKALRARAGDEAYQGGFINHYIIPLIYPSGLSAETATLLGYFVLAVNVLIYSLVIFSYRRRAAQNGHS